MKQSNPSRPAAHSSFISWWQQSSQNNILQLAIDAKLTQTAWMTYLSQAVPSIFDVVIEQCKQKSFTEAGEIQEIQRKLKDRQTNQKAVMKGTYNFFFYIAQVQG